MDRIPHHGERTDIGQDGSIYRSLISGGVVDAPSRVAVVGAGVSGSVCARILHEHGVSVDVFDMRSEAGGRSATRRVQSGDREFCFDTGAQYFTVRDERFGRVLEGWRERGVAEKWKGRFAELEDGEGLPKEQNPDRFVGRPGMSRLCEQVLDPLEPGFGVKVGLIETTGKRWTLRSTKGDALGVYDRVITAVPPSRAEELLKYRSPVLSRSCQNVYMQPTWSLTLGLRGPLEVGFDGAFVNDTGVDWVARNSSKPGRSGGEAWVLHSSHAWARENFFVDGERAADQLEAVFWEVLGQTGNHPGVSYRNARRWRFAEADPPLDRGSLYDPDRGIAVAGDWLNGSRVEGAFMSGCRAAERMLK